MLSLSMGGIVPLHNVAYWLPQGCRRTGHILQDLIAMSARSVVLAYDMDKSPLAVGGQ